MTDNENKDNSPTNELKQLIAESASHTEILEHTKNVLLTLVQYKELRMIYTCAIKEVRTKFEVLNTEFQSQYKRNPINSISTRLKSTDSILHKLDKYKVPLSLDSIEEKVRDFAGVRIICSYIDDIYSIADALLKQDDITLVARKDYIQNPKPNGYRSLHLIVKIPVFFAKEKKIVPVEVQIRTIAMDFWASLEHQIRYKNNLPEQEKISAQLKSCADVIAETDQKMLNLRTQIDLAESFSSDSEDESLLDQLKRLDKPLF